MTRSKKARASTSGVKTPMDATMFNISNEVDRKYRAWLQRRGLNDESLRTQIGATIRHHKKAKAHEPTT